MENLLRYANIALLVSLLGVIGTGTFSYIIVAESHAPLGLQLAGHIGTILFATSLKLSYIVRLTAQKNLGRPLR